MQSNNPFGGFGNSSGLPGVEGPQVVGPAPFEPQTVSGSHDKPKRQKRQKRESGGRRSRSDNPSEVVSRSSRRSAPGRKFVVLALTMTALTFLAALVVLGPEPVSDKTYVVKVTAQIGPGVDLPSSMLVAIPLSPDAVEPGVVSGDSAEAALEAAEGLVGQRPLYPLFEGQQLRFDMFSSVASNLGRDLGPDERLLSIAVPAANALAASLVPGDVIDVVSVESSGVAVLVASAAEVVAVTADESAIRSAQQRQSTENGQTLAPAELLPTDPIPGIYTLRVRSVEAMAVAIADAAGSLYLIGRVEGSEPLSAAVNLLDFACSNANAAGEVPSFCSPLADFVPEEGL